MKKYVFITGATGGLGRAYVKECAKQGYNLILTATNEEKLQNLKKEINNLYKDIKVLIKTSDLSKEQSRIDLIDFIKDKNIKIEKAILNAGYITQGPFIEYKNKEYLTAIRVNCEGNVDLFGRLLELKEDNEKLYVIVVSSFGGFNPMPRMAVYAATKSFLTSFFIAAREELKDKNVKITVVCPSGMATTDEMKKSIKAQGFGGKITENSVESIAKVSLKKNLKNKPIIVARITNKFLRLVGNLAPQTTKAKMINKRWEKAQRKMSSNNPKRS